MSGKKNSSSVSIGDLVGALGKKAPFDFAESWDNVGFLCGDAADRLTGVVVAVNLGPEALKAAADSGANAIVCHHPPIFKPINRLTRAGAPYLYEAVRRGYAVIALHTNFDLAATEVAEAIAAHLSVKIIDYAARRGSDRDGELPASLKLGKFITYVPQEPKDALDKVREAVCKAGAGRIGDYTQCSFSGEGEGTFLGGDGTNPTVGMAGRLERAKERRLEVVFHWKLLEQVLKAAKAAHPYEEMAYDVIALAQPQRTIGYGFIAEAQASNLTFQTFLDGVKQAFQLREVMVAGSGLSDPQMRVKRVAFSPGSGSSFVGSVAAKGADVYVCGEIGYHQMLEARQKGLTLVMLGHSYSERFFVETVSRWCEPLGATQKIFEIIHVNQ